MKKSVTFILFLIVFGTGIFLYYLEGTLPVRKNDTASKIFVINAGESLNNIAKNLANEGFIRNKIIFYFVTKQLGIEKNIQAGDFRLSPSMDVFQVAKTLTHGTSDVQITLIEGTRKEEMARVIAQNPDLDIPETEFIKYAKEGYLFPDTYNIPKGATVGAIINILEANFDRRFSADLQKKAQNKGFSKKEIIILASLVEKEVKTNTDRKIVAGILLKRLKNDWPLQVDASIAYALGYQPGEKTWWKKYLTIKDLKLDSPYNTYVNRGLPPAPIANPGLAAIEAVVNADENTPYWYYISDKTGKMHYAVTLEEQNENVKRYLQ